ncbi:hypothetical protein HPMG_00537 [Helicobacter pullorum MIT 98-5489]|uniref:Uncharacterized protein n=1 Tax=Helicobacter pullorum MIT 98-5489 TaxID=537972 RepID=C5EYW5_9HELI|nr:hypothetical protein [Helicobacter pullorum]EEQ63080.1 hypothetical protein HPMG_00537 [Helicobacter pullorum MIT 98-5489]
MNDSKLLVSRFNHKGDIFELRIKYPPTNSCNWTHELSLYSREHSAPDNAGLSKKPIDFDSTTNPINITCKDNQNITLEASFTKEANQKYFDKITLKFNNITLINEHYPSCHLKKAETYKQGNLLVSREYDDSDSGDAFQNGKLINEKFFNELKNGIETQYDNGIPIRTIYYENGIEVRRLPDDRN